MRAEDPRVGHAHAYLDWCQHQCMVSSAQCALRHGTCHPSPSLSFMLQREWFFFKGFNEMMAFHFLEDEISIIIFLLSFLICVMSVRAVENGL